MRGGAYGPGAVRYANLGGMNQLRDNFPIEPDSKRRFTVDEFERMGMAGILGRDERVELISGEIVLMSPVGPLHTDLRMYLAHFWARASDRALVVAEAPLRLSVNFEPVADLAVFAMGTKAQHLSGANAWLVVEIADSSLTTDTGVKAAAYAGGGVREYWVINARTRVTIIYREPREDGTYGVMFEVAPGDLAAPLLVPELAVRMADIPGA